LKLPIIAAGLILLLTGCMTPVAEQDRANLPALYQQVEFSDLPEWDRDDLSDFATAMRRSCEKLSSKAEAEWRSACAALPDKAETAALRQWLMANFQPWQVSNALGDEGLFTGYYAPEFAASLTRQGRYQTPVYALPRDLVTADLGQFLPEFKGRRIIGRVHKGKMQPYPDRAAIMAEGLAAPVLVWAADPIDVFVLQIQGSGRARFANGRTLELGYAGQNGHGYVPIGRVLRERGAFPDGLVTMPRIRDWLNDNPQKRQAIMNKNPSYVFFRKLPHEAEGAQGVVLTPERSLAVDPRSVPLGTPVWLEVAHPEGGMWHRLMVAQDTGGAIKGAVRGDVYWGYGVKAEQRAGVMQNRGRFWILLPRGVRLGE
jgi:membrane-bound lytic murein transglycosylase A